MRPKKKVLVVGFDELLMSQVSMRLKVWGYDSEECGELDEAASRLREREYDLVIFLGTCYARFWPLIDLHIFQMLDVQQHRGHQLRIFDPANFLPHGIATGVQRVPIFPLNSNAWSSLRETVRLTTCRKRGPRRIAEEYRASERVA